jgi:hypothetical protein
LFKSPVNRIKEWQKQMERHRNNILATTTEKRQSLEMTHWLPSLLDSMSMFSSRLSRHHDWTSSPHDFFALTAHRLRETLSIDDLSVFICLTKLKYKME